MKAAIYKGKQQLRIEQIPTPEPGPGQVLVKIKYCAICGTDVHGFLYDVVPPGTVMGHEWCGTIAQLGPDVTAWKEGERVLGEGGEPPPGKGSPVRTEPRFNYREFIETGVDVGRLKAYAEYTVAEAWELTAIPEGVTDEEAAMCEPCAVAVHAVRVSDLRLGDSVAVLGAGPIGLLTLQAIRAAGAGKVFVSEPAPARAEAARKLGADQVVDPTSEDVVSRMVSLTDGLGPDVAFDCAGVGDTLDDALNMARRSGHVVLVAVPWEQIRLSPVDWMARETSLRTSFSSDPVDWRIAPELLRSGKVTIEPLLSEASFIPLEGIQEAFEELTKPSTQLQVVVKP